MRKCTLRTRLAAMILLVGFSMAFVMAAPAANAARLPYPPSTTSKAEREQILRRYFPKDFIMAVQMPEVTFERLVEALERIEPRRPPVKAPYDASLPQKIEIFDAAIPLHDKTIRLTQTAARYIDGRLTVLNTTRNAANYITIAIPEGLRAPDVSPEKAVDALAEFLMANFPQKLVPSSQVGSLYSEWKSRMAVRSALRSKFDLFVPAHFFDTEKASDQTVAVLLKAFEDLEPERPPVGDDRPFQEWLGRETVQLAEGKDLGLNVVYERPFDVAGFNGPPPFLLKELTLPRAYREGSPEQLRAIKDFLMTHFPVKKVPTRELKRYKREWTKRMIAEGHIAAPPSIAQRAKFYVFGRTCEALFR